ncbi:MAG: M61 family metallopeptidase [Bacteroidia bacterium]|nr:M61 family metallopeptidase [Bacteroidia bacterium]
MKYTLFFDNPQTQLIRVQVECEARAGQSFTLTLPYFRPGRYEQAVYYENISGGEARDSAGKPVPSLKITTHAWRVTPFSDGQVFFTYYYYANEQNAGSSWFGDGYIYVNGVNLLVYTDNDLNSPCELVLGMKEAWPMAGSLKRVGNTLYAENFHEIVDAPFILSKSLQNKRYSCGGVTFHLWFQGACKPDTARMLAEFSAFSDAQIRMFGGFPADEYHFLFIMLDTPYYHGVEHQKSTVIVLGPGYKLTDPALYPEFLGISSHELFHAWNVKAIRPLDMQPYDYSGPQYSRLHYVTEGVTTYYGDLMLLKSGVWGLDEFVSNFNASNLARHYNNEGWKYVSLEESSFESWVTGYKKTGVPNRKISFYTKGAIVALLLDVEIRRHSQNAASLDNVMREMYDRFGKTGKGYTRSDYQTIAESFAGESLEDFFNTYISGTDDVTPALQEAAAYLGFSLQQRPYASANLALWGFATKTENGKEIVNNLVSDGPAALAGIRFDDTIFAINGLLVEGNLRQLTDFFAEETELKVHYFHQNRLREVLLIRTEGEFYGPWELQMMPFLTPEQRTNQENWRKILL